MKNKKLFIGFLLCLSLFAVNVHAELFDLDCYTWTGWSSYTAVPGYLDAGSKSILSGGNTYTSTSVSSLTADTDYVVWVRAYVGTNIGTRAIRTEISGTSGSDTLHLGQYNTQENAVVTGGWYWQKAGVVHTAADMTSVDIRCYQATPGGTDRKNVDQVRLSNDLNYTPSETIMPGDGGIFIDGYTMSNWSHQTFNPYPSTFCIAGGNMTGKVPAAATYDLGGFSEDTTYYVWVRAGLAEDGAKRGITTTISDGTGSLLSVTSHNDAYLTGELSDGNAWYWCKIGSFMTGSDVSLDFMVDIASGSDADAFKSVDCIYLTTDSSYTPVYAGNLMIPVPEPATAALVLVGGVLGIFRRKKSH